MAEKTLSITHVDVEDPKIKKRNLWFYPLGTVGRDMIYTMVTSFLYLYVLYTKELTDAQIVAITMIMVAARVFDAFNDPIMGNIIERTRTKCGKFKPWLLAGSLSTSVVVFLAFNTKLTGWSFVTFFGVIYILYSITYTMNDIPYWGMVPAISRTSNSRNQITARATLFAGIGGTLAGLMIPMFTAGALQLGGNASTAYGIIALIVAILSPLFAAFTVAGVKENRDDMEKPADKISFKLIVDTIFGNDQLRWMVLIFLLHQIANDLIIGGIGANYVYFRYGYEGGLYSLFTTVGMSATALLMIFYPAISRKMSRKTFMKILLYVAAVGSVLMFVAGLAMPANMASFWTLTIGYMLLAFGLYGYHLVLMISIFNTVEYNEYKTGSRREGIITSIRPFITKLAGALVVVITSFCYLIFRVTDFTNKIANLEQSANQNLITTEMKNTQIAQVIQNVGRGQSVGMLLFMVFVPFVLLMISYLLYKRFYKLDEEEYSKIISELEA